MPDVTVYSREECHLCEELLSTIRTVAADVSVPVTVSVVDVDGNPALREEYGDRVPYVFVDGSPTFKYRATPRRCGGCSGSPRIVI